eukprot:TRINITY_DN5689_c0_g2_i1.p1 TRINITY_DN5689_c0_g2~~TRINITY_DN5689_c0_g2_i1.p1  ORF type:complete len:727 (+),score=234.42 TRINITY_DN5689_c0_g2_i1:97-2277(+)
MTMLRSLVLALAAGLLGGNKMQRSTVTPTEKVITLLEDLHTEVKEEGEKEEETYKNYYSFCVTTEEEKSFGIKENEDKKTQDTARLKALQDEYDAEMKEVMDKRKAKEQINAEKTNSERHCTESRTTWEANDADLQGAIAGLAGAIEKMNIAKPTAFLQVGKSVTGLDKILDLAQALGFLEEQKHQSMVALLQGTSNASPADEEEGDEYNKTDYEFQSGGILDTLKKLKDQFSEEYEQSKAKWEKDEKICEDFAKLIASALDSNEKELGNAETKAAEHKGAIADLNKEILETTNLLKEDSEYLTELTETCTARSNDFKQREEARKSELAALEQAVSVMKDNVTALDEHVNKGGADASAMAFFQEVMEHTQASDSQQLSPAPKAALVQADASSELSEAFQLAKRLKLKVSSSLAFYGLQLKSARLSGLASRIQSEPDKKPGSHTGYEEMMAGVEKLVRDMVNNLMEQNAAELDRKGYCDSSMSKAMKERDRRYRESQKMSAKLGALDTKRTELLAENDVLADELRQETIKKATEAKEAVDDALVVLRNFYKGMARRAKNYDQQMSVLQRKEDQEPTAGFQGAYGGSQSGALGVLTLMETCRNDFDKSAKDTKKAETKADADFQKFKVSAKKSIASKETQKKLNEEDIEVAENSLSSGKESLKATVGLMDAALETLETLKPQCVDNRDTIQEAIDRREKEMQALKYASCQIDQKKTEADCEKLREGLD